MTAYDAIDLSILSRLQEDASLSISAIAEGVGLSTNSCWRRIKRLEEDGCITKRVALLDPRKFGVATTVFMSVRTTEHSQEWFEQFAEAVTAQPEVMEFYRISGDADYLIKLQVRDIADYDRVYKRLIAAVSLSDVSSVFAMQELKMTTAIALSISDEKAAA